MSLVKGSDVIVAEYNVLLDIWVLYGCARSCTLNLTRAFIETSVSGEGDFETNKPAKQSFTGTIEGLVNLNTPNLISLPELRAKQIAGDKLLIRYKRTAVNGIDTYTEQAYFYIANSEDSGPYDNMDSFTVELKGTGTLTQVFTSTPIYSNVKRFEYTGTGGELFFTTVIDKETGLPISLAGKTVLGLEKDGIGFSKMITTGPPVDKQFKFDSTTGRIDVPIAFSAGEESFGYYRN